MVRVLKWIIDHRHSVIRGVMRLMRLELVERLDRFVGLSLALSVADIDALLGQLAALKETPDQHFHLSNNPESEHTFVDIAISVQTATESSNAAANGFAIEPDDVA
jgi:hypothetical protein